MDSVSHFIFLFYFPILFLGILNRYALAMDTAAASDFLVCHSSSPLYFA